MKKVNCEYDGMVVFDTPITIWENGEGHPIYGLVYNSKEMHEDDMWQWQLNRYITYLQAVERLTEKGGRSTRDSWVLPSGKIISLTFEVKNFIYKLLKRSRMLYTIIESAVPYKFEEGDIDGEFITTFKAIFSPTDKDII